MEIYHSLEEHFRRIDSRNTNYQFDLEEDICWDRIHEPGKFITDGYLKGFGIDPKALEEDREAADLVQWVMALSFCQNFIDTEESVLRFFNSYAPNELASLRSNRLLAEEETKHIEMFQRLKMHLLAQKPGLKSIVEESFAELKERYPFRMMPKELGVNEGHFLFWVMTVYFEEWSIYFADTLRVSPKEIQPTWLSAHAAHRREETQHVVTDIRNLDALNIDDSKRNFCSRIFAGIVMGLSPLISGIGLASRILKRVLPERNFFQNLLPITQNTLFKDLRTHPSFRVTRRFAPAFAEVSKDSSCAH